MFGRRSGGAERGVRLSTRSPRRGKAASTASSASAAARRSTPPRSRRSFATHGGELLDCVNRPIGEAKPPPGPLLPVVAVPTTAGTGSEATSVAILDFPRLGVKTGISHRYLRPRVGIVDPLLTRDLPAAVTASAGSTSSATRRSRTPPGRSSTREKTTPGRATPLPGREPDRGHLVRSGARDRRRATCGAPSTTAATWRRAAR